MELVYAFIFHKLFLALPKTYQLNLHPPLSATESPHHTNLPSLWWPIISTTIGPPYHDYCHYYYYLSKIFIFFIMNVLRRWEDVRKICFHSIFRSTIKYLKIKFFFPENIFLLTKHNLRGNHNIIYKGSKHGLKISNSRIKIH